MNLHYDPIIGLQYSSHPDWIMICDIATLPKDFNIDNFKKKFDYWQSKSFPIINSTKTDLEIKSIEVGGPTIESNAWFGAPEVPRFSDIWVKPFIYGTGGDMDLEAQSKFRKMFEDAY